MKLQASIIIVNYGDNNLTLNCIKSILAAQNDIIYEIIVVDNNKEKSSLKQLKFWFIKNNNIFVVKNHTKNNGFSNGIKIGSNKAKFNNLIILDNDTTVTDNWLPPLLTTLQSSNVGIATSFIKDSSIGLNICGGVLNKLGFSYANTIKTKKTFNKKIAYGITCWAIKKSVLSQVGIDVNFKFFCDDADIGVKTLSLGYNIVPCKNSVVYHYKHLKDKTSGVNGSKIITLNKDYLIFTYKNLNIAHFILFFIIFVLYKSFFIIPSVIKQRYRIEYYVYDLRGIIQFFRDKTKNNRKQENQRVKSINYVQFLERLNSNFFIRPMLFGRC